MYKYIYCWRGTRSPFVEVDAVQSESVARAPIVVEYGCRGHPHSSATCRFDRVGPALGFGTRAQGIANRGDSHISSRLAFWNGVCASRAGFWRLDRCCWLGRARGGCGFRKFRTNEEGRNRSRNDDRDRGSSSVWGRGSNCDWLSGGGACDCRCHGVAAALEDALA